MEITYIIAPFFAWGAAGSLKFAINTIRSHELAWKQIGYGGLPSTHTTITSTVAFLVGMKEGFGTPLFSIAATVTFIVIIDATSLRRRIGKQAKAINNLMKNQTDWKPLREHMGHHPIEVGAGLATGILCATVLQMY